MEGNRLWNENEGYFLSNILILVICKESSEKSKNRVTLNNVKMSPI